MGHIVHFIKKPTSNDKKLGQNRAFIMGIIGKSTKKYAILYGPPLATDPFLEIGGPILAKSFGTRPIEKCHQI